MLPVLPKIRSPFVTVIDTPRGSQELLRLERMGYLYILASIIQSSWPLLVLKNWHQAREWLPLPIIGWTLGAIWIGMLVCIPFLFYVGCRMVQMGRDPHALVYQSRADVHLMGLVIQLLIIGIVLDLLAVPALLFYVKDPGAVIFLSGLMGGRVLQANMEAVLKYYGQ